MKIDTALIDILLYGEEGVDLDFKRDQYKFTRASDAEKGELLKDILAFANSWRRSDAFILIGIKEVQGVKAKLSVYQRSLMTPKYNNLSTVRPKNQLFFLTAILILKIKSLG